MKKFVLLNLWLLISYSGIALEPVRVAINTNTGNPVQVDVELYDYSSNTLIYSNNIGLQSPNSSGIISFIVNQGTPSWNSINSNLINSSVILNVKTNGTLYAQYRLDQMIFLQAQSGSGTASEPLSAGKLIEISNNNVINKINNLQIVNMGLNVNVDANYLPEGIFRFDMTTFNNFMIDNFINSVDGGVYTFHFTNSSNGGNVTFPTNFLKEDNSALSSLSITNSRMVTFYSYQGKFYTLEQ